MKGVLYAIIEKTSNIFTIDMKDIYINNGNIKIGVRVNKNEFLKLTNYINLSIGNLACIDKNDKICKFKPLSYNYFIKLNPSTVDKYYKHNGGHITYDNRDSIVDNMIIDYIDITDLKYYNVPITIVDLYMYPIDNNVILCNIIFDIQQEPIIAKQWKNDDELRIKLLKQIEYLQNQLATLP